MTKQINSVLRQVLEKVRPKKESSEIDKNLKKFMDKLILELNKKNIDADIFIGGSFAKNTIIKKQVYDIDLFLRFDKKYKNDISKITEKLLKFAKPVKVHGSRDYFKISITKNYFIEVVPVIRIKNPKQAQNITDLSYSHVKYINKKIKNKKILDNILIAKAFCYANNCYGAESYIQGFSGYSLELLVYHYGSFLKLIKAMTKANDEKIIIDIEKHYKNKSQILMDINTAKLISPIILIDPTYKQRNVLAALSKQTFEKFKTASKQFLKNPSIKAFEIKKPDLEKIKAKALKTKSELTLIQCKTNKQEGNMAGSKLKKFYNYFSKEIEKLFNIKDQGFDYNGKKSALYYFVVKPKKEILSQGPNLKDIQNIKKFKKRHKKTFEKNQRSYSREKVKISLKEFVNNWKSKNKKIMKEMSVKGFELLD